MKKPKFGRRVSGGTKSSLAILLGITTLLLVTFSGNGSKPRTDLDTQAILNQDFGDLDLVELKLPPQLPPAKRTTVQYHGKDGQPVELTCIAAQKIGGRMSHLIAVRPIFEGEKLDNLVAGDSITGNLYKDNLFGKTDIARIEKLFPGLKFDHCVTLDTHSGAINLFWLISVMGGLLLLTSCKTFWHIVTDYQAKKMWRRERQTNPDLQEEFDITSDACSVSPVFTLPKLEPPRTNRVISSSINLTIGFAFGLASAAFAVGIQQPRNLWLVLGSIGALAGIGLVSTNLVNLAQALKPIPKLGPSRRNRFTKAEFHRYHKQVLESFGFKSVGLFKLMDKRFELFESSDRSMAAELSLTLCDQRKIDQHSCELTSVFTDATVLTTSTLDCDETVESATAPEVFLASTVAKHIDIVGQYCTENDVKLMPVDQFNIAEVFEFQEITQRRLSQQQVQDSAANFMKSWTWIPDWFRWPVVSRWDNAR